MDTIYKTHLRVVIQPIRPEAASCQTDAHFAENVSTRSCPGNRRHPGRAARHGRSNSGLPPALLSPARASKSGAANRRIACNAPRRHSLHWSHVRTAHSVRGHPYPPPVFTADCGAGSPSLPPNSREAPATTFARRPPVRRLTPVMSTRQNTVHHSNVVT